MANSADGLNIDTLLRTACENKASDLHLKVGNYPYLRVDGELRPLTQYTRISSEDMLNMAFSMMTNRQKQKFKENAELDMAYGVAGLGRFRVNVFQQRGNVGMVLRVIPTKIRTLEELILPRVLDKVCQESRGLVLVTGTTGSGKSTSLAAMIDRINSTRTDHIITIEDPIEFLHRDKKGFCNQREVEVDTPSFGSALRAALRQDPDVILVGEMRDLETIQTALLAAETGHMVFSTLHTMDATETIQRIIAVFPPPEQKQIRLQLASTLKAIISQRLVRKADGIGRVPAVEVLIATEYIRDCVINPDKTRLIHDAISAGVSQYGMQTFDQSLYDLYKQGLITLEEALGNSTNPDEFKLRIAGISNTTDAAREEMEQSSQVDRFAKGKQAPTNPFTAALAMLARRPYSVAEIRRKLEKKFPPGDAVSQALARLRELGYLDDKKFAEQYAYSLTRNRAFGPHRLRRELKAKLVNYQEIEPALERVYEEIPAQVVLEQALAKKLRTLRLPLTRPRFHSLCQHLMRLGFNSGDIIKAVRARPELTPVAEEVEPLDLEGEGNSEL